MNVHLSITKKSLGYQRKMIAWILVFMVLIIVMALSFILEYEIPGRIIACTIFGVLLFSFVRLRKFKRYNNIGSLSLSEEMISINGKEYSIEAIEDVDITYKSFKGETSSVTLFGIYEGDNNQISVKLKNNSIMKMTFLSSSKYDYRWLNELVSIYRQSGVAANLIRKRPYQD